MEREYRVTIFEVHGERQEYALEDMLHGLRKRGDAVDDLVSLTPGHKPYSWVAIWKVRATQ